MRYRKVVQISVSGDGWLFALADDGSIWRMGQPGYWEGIDTRMITDMPPPPPLQAP